MKILFDEKIKALAERNGWSVQQARGYIEGQVSQRRGTPPSQYAQVGIDEYSLAFRAGYYGRSMHNKPVPGGAFPAPLVPRLLRHSTSQ